MKAKKVSVIVAGSWGTALALVLADNGHQVTMWMRDSEQAAEINDKHTNYRFMPDLQLANSIKATTSMEEAVSDAEAIVLVAPSIALREVVKQMKPHLHNDTLIIHATKGFEVTTLKRMSTVIADELIGSYDARRIVVLSGPSHAEEVSRKRPTTVVVAAEHIQAAEEAQDLLMNTYFRVYTNPDVIGVEVSGALKNIIAIGAGLSDGLGFGDNARAALLTRGLAEISRLGVAMGAKPLTFAGLAGVGDLIVTCTSQHSRNWRAGYALAQEKNINDILASMGMVVEGVRTTQAAYILAEQYHIQMPITEQLYEVLFEHKAPKLAVEHLMGRLKKNEMEKIILMP